MKKFLILLSVVFSIFCIIPTYATDNTLEECTPGDDECVLPLGGSPVGHCNNKNDKVGTDCTKRLNQTKVQLAKCAINNKKGDLSCTTLCCKKPYYLKFDGKGGSLGICVTKDQAIQNCKQCKAGNCEPIFEENATYNNCNQNLFKGCQPKQSITSIPDLVIIPDETHAVVPGTSGTDSDEEAVEPTIIEQDSDCTLEFSSGNPLTISNVYIAASKKQNDDSMETSFYDRIQNTIWQNHTSSGPNYKPDIPNLSELIKINDIDIPVEQQAQLKTAVYISFTCSDKQLQIHQPNESVIHDTTPTPGKSTVILTTCSEHGCFAPTTFMLLDEILEEHFTDSSVWKNENGKFNTARLASDSIAGVVLGTVGGVVTSNIIKKNQIENGFEDLKCTIAGQDVANYGDTFNVSLK